MWREATMKTEMEKVSPVCAFNHKAIQEIPALVASYKNKNKIITSLTPLTQEVNPFVDLSLQL